MACSSNKLVSFVRACKTFSGVMLNPSVLSPRETCMFVPNSVVLSSSSQLDVASLLRT